MTQIFIGGTLPVEYGKPLNMKDKLILAGVIALGVLVGVTLKGYKDGAPNLVAA